MRFLAILIALFSGLANSLAQTYPVQATTVLIPPYSLSLEDYQLEKSQDLMVNLTLNDPVEATWDVVLRLTISNNGTDILQTSPNYLGNPITLLQYSTVTLTGLEVSDYLDMRNMIALNGYEDQGVLPEGLNSICVEVLDYNRRDVVLSRKACGSGYAILNDPPFPQLPICGGDVEFQSAQNLMFSWLPMHLGSPNPVSGVEYEFSIVRVEEGYNEFEAMEAASPLYQETTANTSIILQDPILEGGYTYAWRVRVVDAFDGSGLNLFSNDGYSVVCTFHYLEEEEVDIATLYEETDTDCGASCYADLPSNSEIITELYENEVVRIGNFYLTVKEVSSSSGGYFSGSGYVFIPFLLSNMNVTFTDMTVNTDYVVWSGDIVTDIDSDLLDDNYTNTDSEMAVDADAIASINEYVESEGRQANQMEYGSSLGLPIALDNTIGGVTTNLVITGISFGPDVAYLNAVMSFGSSDEGDLIAFGGTGICFHPYGIGGGTASLYLYEDFSLGDYSDIDLTFKAPGPDNDGTFLNFDCTGFQELNIEAEYEFPTDMLVRADGSSDPVVASATINTTEWGQFIAAMTMDEFEVYGVDGYSFAIEEAYIDYSDVANPDDAEFPEDYEDDGDNWKGFYLSTLSMTLPEDFAQATGDLSLGVQNVLIDQSGVSANIFAAGILELESGKLGEWAFSIDTIQLDIEANSLTEGSLLGQIHVPILDEENSLNYAAVMSVNDNELDVYFTINTTEDVSVSMWAAEMTLSSASVIAIEKTDEGFTPYAELHGDLTLDVEIQEGNSFEVEAMSFEGLKINHPDESSRIAVDAFSLFGGGDGLDDEGDEEEEDVEEQETLSDFPVSISNVAFEEGDGDQAGINFDLNINLTGDDVGVAGTANITVTGTYDAAGAPFNAWSFEGVELSAIEVEADLAAGSIVGSLEIYDGDETYGEGFKGLLSAQFTGVGQMDALAQFGKVDGTRYFFVDALVLSQSPFIDILGIGLYGFGGGMYYHMSRDDTDPALNLEEDALYAEPSELGASLSGITYVPNPETLIGMKATMIMGIAPGTGFSADATFEMSFGLSNNIPMVESIALGGAAYMMSPGSILDREESAAIGRFDANLDLSDPDDPIFTGMAEMTVETEAVTGSGSAAMRLSSDEYYLWVGTPDNPVTISVADMVDFNMYADIGTDVPDMPDITEIVPNYSGNVEIQRPSTQSGTQIIFGASFGIDEQDYAFGSFYANAEFGMGFDAYLRKVKADCGYSTGTVGLDGWYLSANAYAYGEGNVGLKVDTWFYKGKVNILNLQASMGVYAQLPNPSYMTGSVAISYSVLSGAIKGDVDYYFEVGEQCEIAQDPLSGLVEIADISPVNGEEDVSVASNPAIALNLPLNEKMTIEQLNDDGTTTTYYYQPKLRSFTLTGGTSEYTKEISDDGLSAELSLDHIMDPYTTYTLTATVKWKMKEAGGSWSWLDDSEETKSATFTTGELPDYLPEEVVNLTLPITNQRNAYDRNSNDNFMVYVGQTGWSYLFGDETMEYVMELEDLSTHQTLSTSLTYNEASAGTFLYGPLSTTRTIWNSWLNQKNGHMFSCTIKATASEVEDAEIEVTSKTETLTQGVDVTTQEITSTSSTEIEDIEIFQWYFRMSDYDTPIAKLNDMVGGNNASVYKVQEYITLADGREEDNYYDAEGRTQYHQSYLSGSDERLDDVEINGYEYEYNGNTVTIPASFTHVATLYNSSSSFTSEMNTLYTTMYDYLVTNAHSIVWRMDRTYTGGIGGGSEWTKEYLTDNDINDLAEAVEDYLPGMPMYTNNNSFYSFRTYDFLQEDEKNEGKAGPGYSDDDHKTDNIRFRSTAEHALLYARSRLAVELNSSLYFDILNPSREATDLEVEPNESIFDYFGNIDEAQETYFNRYGRLTSNANLIATIGEDWPGTGDLNYSKWYFRVYVPLTRQYYYVFKALPYRKVDVYYND